MMPRFSRHTKRGGEKMKERPIKKKRDTELPEFPDQELGVYETLALSERDRQERQDGTFRPSDINVEEARDWSEFLKL